MKNNNYIHHASYLRNIIAYDHDFWPFLAHLYKMMKSPGVFFIFISSFFRLLGGVKGQKMAQGDPKNGPIILSVALHISGTIYHMIVTGYKFLNENLFTEFFM